MFIASAESKERFRSLRGLTLPDRETLGSRTPG
jgi:hypothetical protein